MGFTPLEGLMMATRSGSIDPGIVLHVATAAWPDIRAGRNGPQLAVWVAGRIRGFGRHAPGAGRRARRSRACRLAVASTRTVCGKPSARWR